MVLCRDYQFSTRRACGLIGFSRSSNEYRGRPDRHARIRERLVTLSGKHRRYGYRMLHAKLGQEGFKVNVKVVERLYREERLTLRRRNRKKIPKGVREGAWCPIAANQRWSLDFTMDALANGRKFRTVNLKDDCTRECGICQTSCPLISCGVSDFRGAVFVFGVEPDWSSRLPVSGFA